MSLYAQEKVEETRAEVVQPVSGEEVPSSMMDTGLIGIVVMVAICLNVLLAAIQKVLDIIKDKTATQVDNKIAAIIAKITSLLSKAIDVIGMNRAHK